MITNYYKILNSNQSSSTEEIKVAYRKLVKFWHPDVNHLPEAYSKLLEINEAWEILGNPQKRSLYDRLYNEAFNISLNVESSFEKTKPNTQKNNENYRPSGKNQQDYDIFQEWVKEAKIKSSSFFKEGLKHIDKPLEDGFYAAGEIGNGCSIVFAVLIIGTIAIKSISVFIPMTIGNEPFSLGEFILSLGGITITGIVLYGLYLNYLKKS